MDSLRHPRLPFKVQLESVSGLVLRSGNFSDAAYSGDAGLDRGKNAAIRGIFRPGVPAAGRHHAPLGHKLRPVYRAPYRGRPCSGLFRYFYRTFPRAGMVYLDSCRNCRYFRAYLEQILALVCRAVHLCSNVCRNNLSSMPLGRQK